MKIWRCLVCGYEEEGPEPPDTCPVCGASAEYFEETGTAAGLIPAAVPPADATTSGPILIVGAGIAGVSAVEAARAASPQADITLVSRENELPYYRLNVSRYLANEITRDDLWLHPAEWYEQQGVRLVNGATVAAIDPANKCAALADGTSLPFAKLVLTAGADAFVPPIPGADRAGVGCMRTLRDADAAVECCARGESCVVIGGGILGLEAAGGIARRGCKVAVVESVPWLLPRQLNRRAGELLASHAEKAGIKVVTRRENGRDCRRHPCS